jgi:hypothetical protein
MQNNLNTILEVNKQLEKSGYYKQADLLNNVIFKLAQSIVTSPSDNSQGKPSADPNIYKTLIDQYKNIILKEFDKKEKDENYKPNFIEAEKVKNQAKTSNLDEYQKAAFEQQCNAIYNQFFYNKDLKSKKDEHSSYAIGRDNVLSFLTKFDLIDQNGNLKEDINDQKTLVDRINALNESIAKADYSNNSIRKDFDNSTIIKALEPYINVLKQSLQRRIFQRSLSKPVQPQ